MKASFYDRETGIFIDRLFTGPEHALPANTPKGKVAIAGHYDHRTQRMDIETGEVVSYEAPVDSAYLDRTERRTALRKIRQLEARQLRPMREIAIDPNDVSAHQRLQDIEAEIIRLRALLKPTVSD